MYITIIILKKQITGSGTLMDISIQFNSIQFNSVQFNSIQFNSIQFNSILDMC